ncbi:MAG: inverse autotransporter beta domain-containing protein, partial [Hyphomicrobiales bacterium]|nr:inverse autotransporter beta domain-containing protein [Hyphomicrobiales bacterium]
MMRIDRLLGSVAALALCVSMTSGALAGGLKDGPSTSPKKWQPWVEGGGYLSTERHRGELDLFAPLWQSSVALLFFQASGKVFEDDIEEGNFALGFRQMQGSGWNLGFWTGYDVRNSEVDNTFHQLAFGFEALSDRWDLRANGYVALSDPEASPGLAQVALSGNGIFMTG